MDGLKLTLSVSERVQVTGTSRAVNARLRVHSLREKDRAIKSHIYMHFSGVGLRREGAVTALLASPRQEIAGR